MRLPKYWGTTPAEQTARYPVDAVAAPDAERLVRAVTVDADAATTFRWICQLRVAPYSYDLLDNRGRRSPHHLTSGLEHLEVGQRFAVIFRLVSFETDHHVTAVMLPRAKRWFGDVALTYRVEPVSVDRCRLVCCLLVGAGSAAARVRRYLLGWGDLVMMRKQLLTLKQCAEDTVGQHTVESKSAEEKSLEGSVEEPAR